MSSQIIFFEKSQADYSNPNIFPTASQGADFAVYALNRSNTSAWMTTGSVDADNTTWEVDFIDTRRFSEILLLLHNFKAFTVKYWDGSAYQDFSTPINETTNTESCNRYSFTQVSSSKIQITITGTQVPDSDKYMYQFIATNMIGKLEGWPVIESPVMSKSKKKTKMLSGKLSVNENLGSFSCDLTVSNWRSPADLAIVERLYDSQRGFLVWLCGGDETQFSSVRKGYRKQDLFLMKCTNEYEPEFVRGLYKSGLKLKLKLEEIVG